VDSRPVLHLRSAAWVNARRKKGEPLSGPHLTIQYAPRGQYGERGEGRVEILRPNPIEWDAGQRLVAARREGRPLDPALLRHYRGSMEARWEAALARGELVPGRLRRTLDGVTEPLVADGAILTCSCAAGVDCHRRWAAPFLIRAGWDVVLDGVIVEARG
jgi:hypothetical protein